MKTHLQALLIVAVTLVMLTLVRSGELPMLTVLTVLIVTVVLIMVIGGASRQLPAVLKIILSALTRRPH